MVNELLADQFWPDDNPLGKQLRFAQQPDRWYSVAGVVAATHEMGVRREPQPLIYFPLMGIDGDDGWSVSSATFVVRTPNPFAVAQAVQSALQEVDAEVQDALDEQAAHQLPRRLDHDAEPARVCDEKKRP